MRRAVLIVLAVCISPVAWAERTRLKPGWNLFSPNDDIEYGRMIARDAERKLPMFNSTRVDDYLNNLGRKLTAKAPGERFPYQFRCVNDPTLNAFALPGGFLFIHRGVIEAADNEAQLAGVMAHEIGHVALRHGTNQATKASVMQGILSIGGAVLGGRSALAMLTQIGAEFTADSLLLKYSRDAERQADLIGTQILYDTDYDPRAMSQFFEKIEAESQKGRPPQWLSSHPNPENRIQNVNQEIDRMGGLPSRYNADSSGFREIQRHLKSLPPAPKPGQPRRGDARASSRPPLPSDRHQTFENGRLRLRHPDNWRVYGQGDALTLAPQGGIVDGGRGNQMLAYGLIAAVFEAHRDRHSRISLETATDQLIDQLRENNPRMRVSRDHERTRFGGEPALSTLLTNDSPIGGKESDWLVTVLRPEGLYYFICVAPEGDYSAYRRTFQTILDSIRFIS